MNIGKQIKDKIKLDNLTNVENINNNILNHINDFILDIISIPFTFENNKHIIDEIFNKYENDIFIQFNEDDLNLRITACFEKRFQNLAIICPKCSWKEGLNTTQFANYSEIIKEIISPEILFIFYDLGDINGNYSKVFNNIRLNKNLIIDQIANNFNFYNKNYELSGIICCPYEGHYTAIILDLNKDFKKLNINSNYYYDDCSFKNDLIKLENFKIKISNDLPYILIYIYNN